jgi:hypothetical protein
MILRNSILFIFIIFLFSCKSKSDVDGYTKTKTGIYFKLLQIGEKNKKSKIGDYITCHILYYTGNDSLFFDAIRNIKYTPSPFPGSIQECFSMLSESDSASFFINADNFFNKTINAPLPKFLPPSSYMKVNIKLLTIRSAVQYQKEKQEFLSWVSDLGQYEQLALLNFIEQEQIDVNPSQTGIYRIDISKGTGKQVEKNDTVTVNYEGRFLNGKIFDSTKKRNEPFQFVFGTEMQVIKGLEEAIGRMKQGDHALFIMPSKMAFGENGSSSGAIPAFTSVVFNVEILEVK